MRQFVSWIAQGATLRAVSRRLSVSNTSLSLSLFTSLSLISVCVCVCLLLFFWLALIFAAPYSCFGSLLSKSSVRQKVCSALVPLRSCSIRHGQGLLHSVAAAVAAQLRFVVVWWGGSVEAQTCDSSQLPWITFCLFVFEMEICVLKIKKKRNVFL